MTNDIEPAFAGPTRRVLLRSALVAGVATPLLAACGDEEPAATGTEPTSEATSGGGGEGSTEAIAVTGDVPEGGGVILDDEKVVITQPAAGEFKAFSSICTHQGCPVDNVSDGTINCTCHGSQFSVEDGSVVQGPASAPLPEQKIAVNGGDITLA